MKRNLFFYIHSVAGLLSGIFILLLSLSGAALVFHDELDRFQQPAVYSSGNFIIPADSCFANIQKQYPHAMISNCNLPENAGRPFVFSVYDSSYKKGTEAMQLFLHPQSGSIIGTRGGSDDIRHNFMSWLSAFHNSFHLKKKGEWMLGFFALVFMISLVTGFILYRKNFIPALLFKKTVWKKTNLHQLIGSWALIFNLMIAITGFWMQRYVFKKDFYTASSWQNIIRPTAKLNYNMDTALSGLRRQYPEFTPAVIYFAQSNSGKTAVYGSRKSNSFIHSKKFADVIALDSNGNVAKTRFIGSISADDRYDIINSQIHFGKYGGLPVKIIYSFFGLLTGLLSITGILLWFRRKV